MQLFIRGLGDIAVVEVDGADSVADVKVFVYVCDLL